MKKLKAILMIPAVMILGAVQIVRLWWEFEVKKQPDEK